MALFNSCCERMDSLIERLEGAIHPRLEVRITVREKFVGAAVLLYCRRIHEDYASVYLRFRVKDWQDLQMMDNIVDAFASRIVADDDD